MTKKNKSICWQCYGKALIVMLIATVIGTALRPIVVPANLVMLYLLAVVFISARLGFGAAVMASALSVLFFNFFFVPHEYTLQVADAQYLLTFLGLFVVGFMIASLTNRVQQQADAAHLREQQTAELYALSRDLAATIDLDTIVQSVVRHVSDTFHAETALYLDSDEGLHLHYQTAYFQHVHDDQHVIKWVYEHTEIAGCGTQNHSDCDWIAIPLSTVKSTIGVLVLRTSRVVQQQRLITAFANQAAIAIEAARLADAAQQAQLLREREKLQSALLNSISHDLRTPLVSITGALGTLRENDQLYTETTRQDLLDGAWQEAQRLNRTVANLLDMTRLQSGMMQLKRDWYHVQEVIAIARAQLTERLSKRDLIIDVPSSLPLLELDLTLMGQVIVNLLDNALKYSDRQSPIEIHARQAENQLIIQIADQGDGIPEGDIPHIFDKFYRAHRDGNIGGTGLGLSICEGIVSAHQGKITVQNRDTGGALFSITLPISAQPILET